MLVSQRTQIHNLSGIYALSETANKIYIFIFNNICIKVFTISTYWKDMQQYSYLKNILLKKLRASS